MEDSIFLKLDSLAVNIGSHRLFSNVNLSIHGGEFVSLMGENGVGKTTLLETILGYREPASGKVLFWGEPLQNSNQIELLSRVAWVTSHPERYPAGSTVNNLLSSLESAYSTWNRDLAHSLLDGFKVHRDQRLNTMSLGENTKIRLIKALAFEPDIILLDELTANLSPESKTTVLTVLFDLFSKKKMSVLYVCHSPEEAATLSDRVVVLSSQGLLERNR